MKTLYLFPFLFFVQLYVAQSSCLVGYYPLDGNVTDSVTTALGTSTGTAPAADRNGVAGGGLYFNGSAEAILVDDYDFATRTVSMWFKCTTFSTIHAGLYETDHNGVVNSQTELALKYNSSNSTNYISFYIGGTGNAINYTVNANQWYHIAATRDLSQIKYYVNCNLVGTVTNITNSHSAQGNSNSVLGNASSGNWFFTGVMDELRLFNCALSQADINGICTSEVGVQENSAANNCFNSMRINLQLTDLSKINQVFDLNSAPEKTEFSIYNNIGQVIFSGTYGTGNSFNVPDLQPGLYYYSLKCASYYKSGTISFVK